MYFCYPVETIFSNRDLKSSDVVVLYLIIKIYILSLTHANTDFYQTNGKENCQTPTEETTWKEQSTTSNFGQVFMITVKLAENSA